MQNLKYRVILRAPTTARSLRFVKILGMIETVTPITQQKLSDMCSFSRKLIRKAERGRGDFDVEGPGASGATSEGDHMLSHRKRKLMLRSAFICHI